MDYKEKIKLGYEHRDCQSTLCELEKASGEKITSKEYIKIWKEEIIKFGILSQTKTQIFSTWIIVIGLLAGLIISLMNFKDLFWLILSGFI